MIDLLYSNGSLVRQWDLLPNGQPGCVLDGLPGADPHATAALQKSVAVRTMIANVEAYEAAHAVYALGEPNNGEPGPLIPDPAWVDSGDGSHAPLVTNPAFALQPRTFTAEDGTVTPNPAWVAYDAAKASVDGASAATVAHALWRTPEPSETADAHVEWVSARDTARAALASLSTQALNPDPRPVPAQIALWQARAVLTATGKFASADAALRASGNVAAIALWDYGNTIDRASPTLAGLAQAVGLSSAEVDQLFIQGGAIVL